ncbi:EAL domain-containing protein [Legionella sp. WA2022007384]
MRRIRIIGTAVFLAIIGAILPMIGALFFAWLLAFNQESQTLYEYTSRMLIRAKDTLNQTREVLSSLEGHKLVSACSPEHIQWMREAAEAKIDIKGISYFKHGVELCRGCGVPHTKIRRSKTDLTLPDGLEVGVITLLSVDPKASLITVRKKGNYDVFVDPKRFSDIIVPRETWLAIIYNGKIITEQNDIEPYLLKIIINKLSHDNLSKYYELFHGKERLKPAKNLEKNQVILLDGRMISINQYGPFYFIASEPESFVNQSYKRLQYILLPLGFITAAFIVGLVIYYSQKRLSFKSELNEALKNNELFVQYQPMVHSASGECFGAEALVRWQRPNGQVIRPDLFISYAEEIGVTSLITERVIDIVFREMANFLAQNKKLHISINVWSEDLYTGRIFEQLESKIAKSKIARNQIWIELTERTFLEAEKAKKIIIRARELGYVVVIDDFGTGFSSLSYLQNLPLDVLKIDKTFIESLGMESVISNVTEHIIVMAKSLNLRLVAEGVEKRAQYDYLKQKNVEFIQGYFFSKPLSVYEFMQFCNHSPPDL